MFGVCLRRGEGGGGGNKALFTTARPCQELVTTAVSMRAFASKLTSKEKVKTPNEDANAPMLFEDESTPENSSSEMSAKVKEGWLTKSSIKDAKMNDWQPRYCILKEQALYYLKSSDDAKQFDAKNAQGSIHLNGAIVQGLDPAVTPGLEGDKKFCFSITRQDTPNHMYLFAAPSASDLASWLTALSGDEDWADTKAEAARTAKPAHEAKADARHGQRAFAVVGKDACRDTGATSSSGTREQVRTQEKESRHHALARSFETTSFYSPLGSFRAEVVG